MNLWAGAVHGFLGEIPLNRPDVNPMCLPAPASEAWETVLHELKSLG